MDKLKEDWEREITALLADTLSAYTTWQRVEHQDAHNVIRFGIRHKMTGEAIELAKVEIIVTLNEAVLADE